MNLEEKEKKLKAKALQIAERSKRLMSIEEEVRQLKHDIELHMIKFTEKIDQVQNTHDSDVSK